MQVGATSWPLEKTSPTLKSGEYAYVFAVDGGTAFYSVLLSTGVCFPSPGTSFCLPMHVCLLASLSPTQKALSHIHACMSPHGCPEALRIAPHAMLHETCICPVGYFQRCTVALTPTIPLSTCHARSENHDNLFFPCPGSCCLMDSLRLMQDVMGTWCICHSLGSSQPPAIA